MKETSGDEDTNLEMKKKMDFVIVGIVQSWNPGSVHAANVLEDIRTQESLSCGRIFILQADREHRQDVCKMDIHTCPALCFYWQRQLLTIRRDGWADSHARTSRVMIYFTIVHKTTSTSSSHRTFVQRSND